MHNTAVLIASESFELGLSSVEPRLALDINSAKRNKLPRQGCIGAVSLNFTILVVMAATFVVATTALVKRRTFAMCHT